MSDRGDYRSFYCTFWDDADVHAMSDNAYRVFTTVKGTLSAAGIGVVYLSQLSDRCGKSLAELESAFVELEQPKGDAEYGWIVRERNIIWIVNGLKFEPTLTSANWKHRSFVSERCLAPLGEKASIVAAYRRYYAEWFRTNSDTAPDAIRNGMDRVSKHSPIQSSPSHSNPDQSDVVDDDDQSPTAAAPELTAVNLSVWSNGAAAERWGKTIDLYTPAMAEGLTAALRDAGVEAGTARLSIYQQCRESTKDKRPNGPAYFKPGILDAWAAELARRTQTASGERPPPRATKSKSPPTTGSESAYAKGFK